MRDDDWTGFWIGTALPRRLEVTHLGPITDGLHRFGVDACADGFSARFECETLLDGLARFRDQVEVMYEFLQGTAGLRFVDDSVRIDGEVNRFGHVLWQVRLAYRYGENKSTLEFDIREDQTMLRNVVAKIDTMLEAVSPQPD